MSPALPATSDTPSPISPPVWRTSAADESLLLQAALVGSSQTFHLPSHADANDPVALLLRQVHQQAQQTQDPNMGNHLLRLAGTWAWCKRAGQMPPSRHSDAKQPLPPVAETRAIAPADWNHLQQQALALEKPRLYAEVLRGMNQMQYRAPTDSLHALLQLGRQTVAIRPLIQAVLGERGRWLGSLNRDWAWAQGVEEQADTETLWVQGSLEQRLQVLKTQRSSESNAARERLIAMWPSLPAKERHLLLESFTVGLSADDEAFLETQLQKDRSSDVRRTAADLLAALPNSAYSQRMTQRLAPLVQEKNAKNKLVVEAPAEPSVVKDAKGQVVGTHPTHLESEANHKTDWPDAERSQYDGLGPRAWLLYQFVRRSSLQWWTTHTGLTPADLVKQAKQTDWTEALLRGWLHACIFQPDPDWILALLTHSKTKQWGDVERMLSQLSADQRDEYQLNQWAAELVDTEKNKLDHQARHLLSFLNTGLEHLNAHQQWSERISTYIAQVLETAITKQLLPKELNTWLIRDALLDSTCALHPKHLSVLQTLPLHVEDQPGVVNDSLRTIHHIISLRLKLQELLAATASATA